MGLSRREYLLGFYGFFGFLFQHLFPVDCLVLLEIEAILLAFSRSDGEKNIYKSLSDLQCIEFAGMFGIIYLETES